MKTPKPPIDAPKGEWIDYALELAKEPDNVIPFPSPRLRALRALFALLNRGEMPPSVAELVKHIEPNCPCSGCRKFFGGARSSNEIMADLIPADSAAERALLIERLKKIPNVFFLD